MRRRGAEQGGSASRRRRLHIWTLLAAAGAAGVCSGGITRWAPGSAPSVGTGVLVPQSSYVKAWQDDYDRYFSRVALPVDFPILGNFTKASSGPALVHAFQTIRDSPLINASSVRDWYSAYRAFCYGGPGVFAHPLRGTMQHAPFCGQQCTCGEQHTLLECYPDTRSFDRLNALLFIKDHQADAADIRLTALQLNNGPGVHAAKIGCSTQDGGSSTYMDQAHLPKQLHELAVEAFPPMMSKPDNRMESNPLSAYAFSLAFPFFELWAPARLDLLFVLGVGFMVDAGLCALVLEPWACAGALLAITTALSFLLFVVDFIGEDFNIVSAVSCMLCLPTVFDLFFVAACRCSNPVVVHAAAAEHPAIAGRGRAAQAGKLDEQAVGKHKRRQPNPESSSATVPLDAVLGAPLFASAGTAVTVSVSVLLMLRAASPINTLFVLFTEATVGACAVLVGGFLYPWLICGADARDARVENTFQAMSTASARNIAS